MFFVILFYYEFCEQNMATDLVKWSLQTENEIKRYDKILKNEESLRLSYLG